MEDRSIISQEDMEDHRSIISQEDMGDDYTILSQEDHSLLSQEDDQIDPEDEIIISYYLTMMVNNRKSWPNHFLQDEEANVYNMNPWRSFNTPNLDNFFIFVKRRTESCGKTDGSVSGCWRIMARDKPIKSEQTGRILGFKKILKFCENDKKRSEEEEVEVIWVMEEYRLVDKWKQDQVICKIRVLLRDEVTSLLATQFSFLSKWIMPLSRKRFMPKFDLCGPSIPTDEIVSYYLKMCVDVRNNWPSHFLQSEQVYGVAPWKIVDADQSSLELYLGRYFFVNRAESSGRTDGCCEGGGCWRIMRRDKVISSKRNNEVLGFKRMFKFCVKEEGAEPVYKFWGDEKYEVNEFKVTWVMDEYRLAKKKEQGKVICRISLLFPALLVSHFKYF